MNGWNRLGYFAFGFVIAAIFTLIVLVAIGGV